MNFLFLSTIFPDADQPSRGTYNLQTCRALAKEHRVSVIAPRHWPGAVRAGVKRRQYLPTEETLAAGIETEFPTFWYPPKVLRKHYGMYLWKSVKRTVQQVTRKRRPDAIISYWSHPDGEAAVRAARMLGVPVAVITGGSDVLLLTKNPARRDRICNVLHQSDAVLTVSDGLRDSVIELGIDAERVHTVYQGIDEQMFHSGDRRRSRVQFARQFSALAGSRPMLLWVGRMESVKRLDVLLEACTQLRQRGRGFVVCLIGEGSQRAAIEQQVERLQLTDSVCLTGSLSAAQLGDAYRAADLSVLTSDSEGVPNVLRESLACGTPFVATNVGSVRELGNDQCRTLVPPGDASAFADAVLSMLDHPPRDIRSFPPVRTWDERADEIVALLRNCQPGVASTNPKERQPMRAAR